MNHYEVLGVKRSASKAEIRRAYLTLARRYHPDFHHGGSSRVEVTESDGATEMKIRQVNAAWEVLGDEQRRAYYDEVLMHSGADVADQAAGFRGASSGAPTVSRIHRPSSEFTPKYSGPDPDEVWRYGPDEVDPTTVPARLLLAAPVVCFVVGLGLLILSVPTAIRAFTAIGLICLFASAMLFVGVPVVAMFKSRSAEQRIHEQRARQRR